MHLPAHALQSANKASALPVAALETTLAISIRLLHRSTIVSNGHLRSLPTTVLIRLSPQRLLSSAIAGRRAMPTRPTIWPRKKDRGSPIPFDLGEMRVDHCDSH